MFQAEQLSSILLIFFAGIINGSFALPTKYVKDWTFENTWLLYALFAFALMPMVLAKILIPSIFEIYLSSGLQTMLIMFIGGALFGAGQVAFALAIASIGIGLTYVICLGLAMGLGFILPLVFKYPEKIFTPFGLLVIIGTLLALVGLLLASYAGRIRDQGGQNTGSGDYRSFRKGIALAVFAGLTSAGQNLAFAMTANLQDLALQKGVIPLGAAFVMWPGFLLCTFIPYALYMIWLHNKNHSWACYKHKSSMLYFLFAFIMALFWLGSLVLYSKASLHIGMLGPVIGWPLFMVLIILSSTYWSWRKKEWVTANGEAINKLKGGIIALILSVLILSASSTLNV